MTLRPFTPALTPTLAILIAPLAAGCPSPVLYQPDRKLMAAIPTSLAIAELRGLLAIAGAGPAAGPCEVLRVDAAGFAVRSSPRGISREYAYRSLRPHAYVSAGGDRIVVKLDGEIASLGLPGSVYSPATLAENCLWFAKKEDAEKSLEALVSLGSPPPPAPD